MPTPQKRAYAHSTMPMSPKAEADEKKSAEAFVESERKKKEWKILDDYKSALIAENQELLKERNARRIILREKEKELQRKKDILNKYRYK